MQDNWRYTATSITKYNPVFRDENGYYKKREWIGFSQIGQFYDGEEFTFRSYLETEHKYIQAVIYFFQFHNCKKIILRNVEKYDVSEYKYNDKQELILLFDQITEGYAISIEDLSTVVKLILRELFWADLFCSNSEENAVRFGYDFYMYFNSNTTMAELFVKIKQLGLFIY